MEKANKIDIKMCNRTNETQLRTQDNGHGI
ncbi:MAG: hypothetical protein ACI9QC_000246 [Oceanicoccus sp.]|jgi:hypothetical protein